MSPTFWTALRRGLSRRCPRCGEGRLFRGWISANERCTNCDLVYQPNRGDTWMFIVITDRIPLGFAIAALYFGITPHGPIGGTFLLLALAVPLIATMPHRQGLAMALDYVVSRAMRGGESG